MDKSKVLAILGVILPSYILSSSALGIESLVVVGFGWIFFQSSFLGGIDYIGVFLSDPRIFILPADWEGFNTLDLGGLGAEGHLRSFFSNSLTGGGDSISVYGLLFTIGMVLALIGLLLLFSKKKTGAGTLIVGGALGLVSLLMFNQEFTGGLVSTLPIPVGSILLIIAGALAYNE